MPVESYPLDEGRIQYIAFIDPFTAEEMEENWAKNHEIRIHTSKKLHILLDLRQLRKPPPPGAIRGWRDSSVTHSNAGHIAMVGGNAITRFIANTVFRLAHFDRGHFFETYDDALAFLRMVIAQEIDSTNP
jgi:hypothetical protein